MRISDRSSDVCSYDRILGDEHFAMLERAHRACIDVDVGVALDHADLESARLQHSTQRSGRDTFTERGHHVPGDKNESRLMRRVGHGIGERSEEHTSELQSLMRSSHAVSCLKKTNQSK